MEPPKICVVDMRRNALEADTLSRFDKACVVCRVRRGEDIYRALASSRSFDALCFEYDWPDIPSLMLIRDAKLAQPSVPIVMITQEHSEALAVWALRTGLWDYFVVPVEERELRSCLDALAQIPKDQAREGRRKMLKRSGALPREARFRDDTEPLSTANYDRAREYVERNLSRKITQSEVAYECDMSTWQFSREFKKHFGMTFQDYVQQRRIDEARRLLKNPSASVTDVCFSVGFVDPAYFSRTFRRLIGISPSDYKRRLTEA